MAEKATALAQQTTRWQEGYNARYAGKSAADNPYKRSSLDHAFWHDGWSAADIELARGDDE